MSPPDGFTLSPDMAATGLPAPSVVRSAKIATIEAQDAEQIGQMPPEDRDLVAQVLRGSIGQTLSS